MGCPEHGPECRWFQHNGDRVGLDLGVGEGWRSGRDFALAHAPMASHEWPLSDGRGDLYAQGFSDGVMVPWCPQHAYQSNVATRRVDYCLGRWNCRKNLARGVDT